jgi:DNA-binding transcriptional LysR family regulator
MTCASIPSSNEPVRQPEVATVITHRSGRAYSSVNPLFSSVTRFAAIWRQDYNSIVPNEPIGATEEFAMTVPGFAEMCAFVAIVEERSFAKAAVRLGVSASTLSESLRKLEQRLAVRLVERTTRSVAVTEAGEHLLTRLRPVLEAYEAALDSINDFRDKPRGQLRVAAGAHTANLVIAPVVARFLAQYPEIRLEISVDDAPTDIVAGRFDAGIRSGERLERDMIAVRLTDELRYVVVASSAYLESRGRPKTPHDLLSHNCICFRGSSVGLLPWRFARNGESFEAAVEGTFIVNDLQLALTAARDGLGLLQLPTNFVESFIAEGELETVLDDWAPPLRDGYFLYYPSRRHTRAPLRAFVDFLCRAVKVKGGARMP